MRKTGKTGLEIRPIIGRAVDKTRSFRNMDCCRDMIEMDKDNRYIILLTTVSNIKEAETIATRLIKDRLGACVQILLVKSIYFWKNKIENDDEYLCIIKTRSDLYNEVESLIKDIHSYETPEIVAVDIKYGSKEYLKWISDSTR